jgi:hypothetical protein
MPPNSRQRSRGPPTAMNVPIDPGGPSPPPGGPRAPLDRKSVM